VTGSRSILIGASLVALLLVGTPDSAAAKCGTRTASGNVVLIDYEIRGIFPETEEGRAGFTAALATVRPEEILHISIGCHEEHDLTSGAVTRRVAVMIVSKSDAAWGETFLREIAASQVTFREGSSHFAPSLEPLRPHFSRHLLNFLGTYAGSSVILSVEERGWSATLHLPWSEASCHVFVGDIASPHLDLAQGIPQCIAVDMNPSSQGDRP
jgi:hypothetical protein